MHFPPEARSSVLDELRDRRARLKALGCNYWVFEPQDAAGLLIEFLEAADPDTLLHARRATAAARADDSILLEVEL
jgi:hypothetical protein